MNVSHVKKKMMKFIKRLESWGKTRNASLGQVPSFLGMKKVITCLTGLPSVPDSDSNIFPLSRFLTLRFCSAATVLLVSHLSPVFQWIPFPFLKHILSLSFALGVISWLYQEKWGERLWNGIPAPKNSLRGVLYLGTCAFRHLGASLSRRKPRAMQMGLVQRHRNEFCALECLGLPPRGSCQLHTCMYIHLGTP